MNLRSGASSLTALLAILFLSAGIGGLGLYFFQLQNTVGTWVNSLDSQKVAEDDLILLATELAQSDKSFYSKPENFAFKGILKAKTWAIEDQSKFWPLNHMSHNFLASPLVLKNFNNRTPDQLGVYRFQKGPFTDEKAYESFFSPETLKNNFTLWSTANLNTVDELALEKMVTLRTGSTAVAYNLRQKVHQKRVDGYYISEDELPFFLSPYTASLEGVFSVKPEINVNTASTEILLGAISLPSLSINNPEMLVQGILNRRSGSVLDKNTLLEVLGLEKNHLVYQYLGVESNWIKITLNYESGVFTGIFKLDPRNELSRRILLISRKWEHK